MQIGILINDREYREALIERLLSYDNDLLVKIINGQDSFNKDSLILTDISPESLEKNLLLKLSHRTLFLSSSTEPVNNTQEYHEVFKYVSVDSILSEASLVYKEWRGIGYDRNHSAKIISVIFENDADSYDKCTALARQIVYSRGDRVLILSLSFINDYGCDENTDGNRFARMMYSFSTGRHDAAFGYTYTDSYGISALMLNKGKNPLAYLDEEELAKLIDSLSSLFDTLILDIGTCYRNQNLALACRSDNIVCFENGRRALKLEEMLSDEALKKVIRIKSNGDTGEAMSVADAISQIYGQKRYEGEQE